MRGKSSARPAVITISLRSFHAAIASSCSAGKSGEPAPRRSAQRAIATESMSASPPSTSSGTVTRPLHLRAALRKRSSPIIGRCSV